MIGISREICWKTWRLHGQGKPEKLGRHINVTTTNRSLWTIVSLHSPKLLYFWSGRVWSRWQEPSGRNGLRKRRKSNISASFPGPFYRFRLMSMRNDVSESKARNANTAKVFVQSRKGNTKTWEIKIGSAGSPKSHPYMIYCQHANTMFPLDEKWIY